MEDLQITQAELDQILMNTASAKENVQKDALVEIAKAVETPIREAVLVGDILFNIFMPVDLRQGANPEFPLDFIAPGTEKDFVAYTIPGHGRIPEKRVEGDYVMVSTYGIGNSIDWLLRYARDARWDIVGRALQVLEAGFTKKMNDDGWQTILSAGVDRNIVVYDTDANVGQFTKRLISVMKTVMRRNGGGNSTSINRGKLTDVFFSPESMEDIRQWGIDQVDEFTRREIYTAADGTISSVFGVALHDLDELGEGQEYQNFFLNSLGASLAGTDVELVVGLDLSKRDTFVMPIKQNIELFPDNLMHRSQKAGIYGWGEFGFGVLDNRRVLLGSL